MTNNIVEIKVALVNLPDKGISGKGYSAPLGLAYIGSIARQLGCGVKGYDLCYSKEVVNKYYLVEDEDFIQSIIDYSPDVIGLSCSTTNRINVRFWSEVFKKNLPATKIVIGGPHPYFIPHEYLKSNSYADILVMGEGEIVFGNYLKAISSDNNIDQVHGLAYRDGDAIKINQNQSPVDNLDQLPFPARDLFPMEKYDLSFGTITGRGKTATLITSRGCVNTCKFCCTTRYWKKVRFRSPGNVVDEIENIQRQFPFIQNFVFFDDTLTAYRDHALGICREINDRGLDINWGCWSRTDILDEEYFEILKSSGCTTLSYGIESGNDQMLETMRKKSTVENNLRALTMGRQKGIYTRGTMILGMPEEQIEWVYDSVAFIARAIEESGISLVDLRPSMRTFIFPGTYWEQWFRREHADFSWEAVPWEFSTGSICDFYGNIVLPCYQWNQLAVALVRFMLVMVRFRQTRKLMLKSWFRRVAVCLMNVLCGEYPYSVYDVNRNSLNTLAARAVDSLSFATQQSLRLLAGISTGLRGFTRLLRKHA